MLVCKESLELSRRLISSDQLPYQEDLEAKFVNMLSSLGPLIGDEAVESVGATVSNVAQHQLFYMQLHASHIHLIYSFKFALVLCVQQMVDFLYM